MRKRVADADSAGRASPGFQSRRSHWIGPLAVWAATSLPSPNAGAAEPRVQLTGSVTETVTDNYLVTGARPASDSVTRLTAGVGLNSQSGRTRGFLDYSLSSVIYARHSESNELQNRLNANFSADLSEGRSRLDVRAGITQSAISAFGVQPGGNNLNQANSTELRFLSVTPVVYGPLGPQLRYTASLNASISDAKGTDLGSSTLTSASVRIEPLKAGRLTWAVDGTANKSEFKAGRTTLFRRLNGTAYYPLVELDLQLNASVGTEVNDLNSLQSGRHATYGLGMVWRPSARTNLTANFDDRSFGRMHNLSFEHRTALTTWRLSDSRSVTTGNGDSSAGSRGTAYNLLYAQLASIEPDPGKRADLVNSTLLRSGISPTSQVNPSFLNSGVSAQDRQEVSVAVRGVRSTLIVSYSRTTTSRLDLLTAAPDDLSQSTAIHLQGFSLDLSHRLTPNTSLNLLLNDQRGAGNGSSAQQFNRQRQASLLYSMRPTEFSSLSVGLRRALYENSLQPFDETALFATYGIRF